MRILVLTATIALAAPGLPDQAAFAAWRFEVRFSEDVRQEPLTGRVYVFFSKRSREPRRGPDWFRPGQFVARDVKNLKPGETIAFDSSRPDEMLSFPGSAAELRLSGRWIQAVMRFNPHERRLGTGPGNGYSDAVKIGDIDQSISVNLDVTHLVAEPEFRETKSSRLLTVRSSKLSDSHGREVHLRASVRLPAGYFNEPDRRYPVILIVPGFGGDHLLDRRETPLNERNPGGVEFIRVLLDPSCPLGHHVFADSANNGPVGAALVDELIPELDERFRTIRAASARFLTGHSSGGWSTLWLQITYPDTFGGCWSTAPDSVDFRDFQRINVYRPGENMYVDADGNGRPIARMRGQVLLSYRDFAKMERVLGYGGQLHSFEAVFSRRGEDGRPRLLWDRETGVIDTDVARTWERYDIRLLLEREHKRLAPKLRGKLHVFMGDQDTFYLEGATRLLRDSLSTHYPDAVVELHANRDHWNLMTAELRNRIRREMATRFLSKHRWPTSSASTAD